MSAAMQQARNVIAEACVKRLIAAWRGRTSASLDVTEAVQRIRSTEPDHRGVLARLAQASSLSVGGVAAFDVYRVVRLNQKGQLTHLLDAIDLMEEQ